MSHTLSRAHTHTHTQTHTSTHTHTHLHTHTHTHTQHTHTQAQHTNLDGKQYAEEATGEGNLHKCLILCNCLTHGVTFETSVEIIR